MNYFRDALGLSRTCREVDLIDTCNMVAQVELHRHYGPQKLLAIGQDLYKQQKYTEALEALTAVCEHASRMSWLVSDWNRLCKLPETQRSRWRRLTGGLLRI